MPALGYFLALNRDDARQLFGLRDAADLFAFVGELSGSDDVQREDRLLRCGEDWEQWQKGIGAEAAYPLDHCILGGRDLAPAAAQGTILLKRPDTVAHIAEALQKNAPESAPLELRDFYQRAAAQKCAVVFVAENNERE